MLQIRCSVFKAIDLVIAMLLSGMCDVGEVVNLDVKCMILGWSLSSLSFRNGITEWHNQNLLIVL